MHAKWIGLTVAVAALSSAPAAPAQQHGRTLLAVFAHPDDERIAGPVLARYSREGVRVVLVIATDGRKGITPHAGIPAGDSLARLRAEEARCATGQLGIEPPRLLGLEDAGLASFTALAQLRDSLSAILRELRPDAIVTYGPEGGTGHPDHRLVGSAMTELVQRGVEGAPQRLYYPSLPLERMRDAPPARPAITATAERFLSARIAYDAEDFQKTWRAFECHATQYTAEQVAAAMRYIGHGWAGRVHLRPWRGSDAVVESLF